MRFRQDQPRLPFRAIVTENVGSLSILLAVAPLHRIEPVSREGETPTIELHHRPFTRDFLYPYMSHAFVLLNPFENLYIFLYDDSLAADPKQSVLPEDTLRNVMALLLHEFNCLSLFVAVFGRYRFVGGHFH